MQTLTLTATCSFGLESVLASELRRLGFDKLETENGSVSFPAAPEDIARCNIFLRTADRVLLRMGRFKAADFGRLFDETKKIAWEELVAVNGKMHVIGKSVKSRLHSVPDCQSIVKKAVIEAMKRRYPHATFEENGPVYKIQVAMLKDVATLTVDTSGAGLHKRGYRTEAGSAPLKETMAAALVLLSRWRPERVFADPCCGSGTIGIEAGLIGRNIPPGLNRSFAAEQWSAVPADSWDAARKAGREGIRDAEMRILCSDWDFRVLAKARDNADNAGLGDCISFQKQDFSEFRSKRPYGCMITNPPYGERTGGEEAVAALYRDMGRIWGELDKWSIFVLSANEEFETHFGAKAHKNRKLYNAAIKCYFYQYFGPLPPLREADDESPSADG